MTFRMDGIGQALVRLAWFAAVAVAAVPARAPAQNNLFLDPLGSSPPDAGSGVLLNAGKKGLMLRFGFIEGGVPSNAFTLDLNAATVKLQVGAGATVTCNPSSTPPVNPNTCNYTVAAWDAMSPLRYAKLMYSDLFPVNTSVTATITGARVALSGGGFATQDPGVTTVTFTTGSMPGTRPPAAVALVFDISGSMGSPAIVGGTPSDPTRMMVLKKAAAQFMSLLPAAVTKGDKIGAVYFSDATTIAALGDATDAAFRSQLLNSIEGQQPTNGTSIGGGLKRAASLLNGLPAPRSALLFSDGEQNVTPCVGLPNSAGCTSTLTGSDLIVDGTTYPNITVCPVMAGRIGVPGWTLQQKIGDISCHVTALSIRDNSNEFASDDMSSFFAQVLATMFPGDKLEIARDVSGQLPPGSRATERFLAGPRDAAMAVSLTWQGPMRRLGFRLIAPDGTPVDISKRLAFSDHLTTLGKLRLPVEQDGKRIPTKGEWQVLIDSTFGTPGSYHLLVLLDNETIASEFQIAAQDIGTSEPVPIRVKLTDGGVPVLGATVAVQVSGPKNGVGNMLATAPTPAGTPPASNDPYRDELAKKIALLVSDPAFAGLFADQTLPGMALLDDGIGADATANDGIYSGRLQAANEEGHYQFTVAAKGTSPLNGDFQRTQKLVTFVRAKPNATATSITLVSSTTQTNGSVISVIKVVPRDTLRRFLGPGYVGYMNVGTSQGTIVSPLHDNLDGSYLVSVQTPSAQANPTISVVILGTPVKSVPLDDLRTGTGTGTGTGGPPPGGSMRALSLHAGVAIPHSTLSSNFNSSISLGADLEFPLVPPFSLEAYLGHDRFRAKSSGSDFSLTHLSLSGKATLGTGMVRPSVDAGVGGYAASGLGGGTHFGWSLGAALQYWWMPTTAVEASYHFRNVNHGDWRYSTIQGGIRWSF
jgi:von Willebrand factor type A domain.